LPARSGTAECDLGCSANYAIGGEEDLDTYDGALDASLPMATSRFGALATSSASRPSSSLSKIDAESAWATTLRKVLLFLFFFGGVR
jgi:hypothetical protein